MAGANNGRRGLQTSDSLEMADFSVFQEISTSGCECHAKQKKAVRSGDAQKQQLSAYFAQVFFRKLSISRSVR